MMIYLSLITYEFLTVRASRRVAACFSARDKILLNSVQTISRFCFLCSETVYMLRACR
jgi:predicted transcriptional regulator